jgi:hypothetical protein
MRHMYVMNDVTEYLMFLLMGSNWQMIRIENCSTNTDSFISNIIDYDFKIMIILADRKYERKSQKKNNHIRNVFTYIFR